MELSAREVQDKDFATALRGYDRAEVDAFLEAVAHQHSRLEEELAIATAKAERAREELDRLNDVLESRLEETRLARAAILDEARTEAAAIVATAHEADDDGGDTHAVTAASAVLAEAETKAEIRLKEVEAIRVQAEAEAVEREHEAEQVAAIRMAEADRVLDEARRDAREIRRRAEADRSEMESQLAQLRRIVAAAATFEGDDLSEINIEIRDGNEVVIDLTTPLHVPAETTG